MTLPSELRDLPIYGHLEAICDALRSSPSRFLVLTAETAAGKSTALPIALLEQFSGGIYMLEPRRLAVLNIAGRVASLLGEPLGQTAGYQMHLEKRLSPQTRFTVLTEAILTRKLQTDPSLDGISVVVIDEFHERSIHADLALAFLKEAMQLRDDLYVVVMSATIQTERLCAYLDCPCYAVPGRQFEVQIRYEPRLSPAQAVRRALSEYPGTILVFLPGIAEIRRVQRELQEQPVPMELLILHSAVPFEEQQKVLRPAAGTVRRVILSSAIAETSVTVPDVSVVIDSGLCRLNTFNNTLGMETLITRQVSQFSAQQRAGRAGRVQNGVCIRLWAPHEVLVEQMPPEILRTDLCALLLECAEWGIRTPAECDWLDSPGEGAWNAARELALLLGCIDAKGALTPLGKGALQLGAHPRIACVALSGIPFQKTDLSTACAIQCLDGDKQNTRYWDIYRKDMNLRVQRCERNHLFSAGNALNSAPFSTTYALLCGYPDRLAVHVAGTEREYLFPSGRTALLPPDAAAAPPYIVAPRVDAGERTARIYAYEPLQEDAARSFMAAHATCVQEVTFSADGAKLQKTEYTRYGKIILKEKKLPVTDADYVQALAHAVAERGLDALPLSPAARTLLLRVQFEIQHGDSLHLAHKYAALSTSVGEWLAPFVPPRERVTEQHVVSALSYYFDGDSLGRLVPVELVLPTGKKCKVRYESQNGAIVPSVEFIIQQAFGCFATPQIMGVPVLFKLLSPARRPLQITSDLEHFWRDTWPEICSEMKGRYPKHNWDYRVPES